MTVTYTLTSGSGVVRSDGAFVPNDPTLHDWQNYQSWLASGNTPSSVPAPTQAQLVELLVAAAGSAAVSLVTQVMPDATHQAAFQNAASIINGNGGVAPSSGPLQTAFAALAAAYGVTPTNFVTLVLTAQASSLTLGAAVAALNSAAVGATTAAELATALAAFETAIGGVVSSLNAVFPSPLISPAAISIPGIN